MLFIVAAVKGDDWSNFSMRYTIPAVQSFAENNFALPNFAEIGLISLMLTVANVIMVAIGATLMFRLIFKSWISPRVCLIPKRTDLLAKHLGIAKGKVDAYVKKHGLENDGKAIKSAWEYFAKHSSLDDANLAEALQKNEVDTLKALEEEAEKEAKKVKEAYLEYLKKLFFVMKME